MDKMVAEACEGNAIRSSISYEWLVKFDLEEKPRFGTISMMILNV